jgi:hypothetical protein
MFFVSWLAMLRGQPRLIPSQERNPLTRDLMCYGVSEGCRHEIARLDLRSVQLLSGVREVVDQAQWLRPLCSV